MIDQHLLHTLDQQIFVLGWNAPGFLGGVVSCQRYLFNLIFDFVTEEALKTQTDAIGACHLNAEELFLVLYHRLLLFLELIPLFTSGVVGSLIHFVCALGFERFGCITGAIHLLCIEFQSDV
jgi:hypothetical protein